MKKIIRKNSLVLVSAALITFANPASSSKFDDDLERVDNALKTNPTAALRQSLESCQRQRNFAVRLYRMGMPVQAQRSLHYCFESLRLPETEVVKVTAPSEKELQARANREYDKALALTPDVANGLAIYRECAACHQPEGWGNKSGSVPAIAGQHSNVVIKQLADFRAGNRDSALMVPYATVESIGGAQAVADVAAYVSTLEISVANGNGPGTDLDFGKRRYQEHCAECHGASGEGSNDGLAPRIQAQNYKYLVRQFQWIREGKRRNSSAEMAALAQQMDDREMRAILDYSSRLLPPEELRAPEDWKNPDFN
ncbi:MAG: c-type cytochrome [Halieaceae bacterium]